MKATYEVIGRRVYLLDLPFARKDEAKFVLSMTGSNWDAARRQWWVGSGKLDKVREYLDRVNAGPVEATPASAAAAVGLGLGAGTPAMIVADALADAGNAVAESAVRASETVEQIMAMRVYAKVTYKGRTFFVVAEAKDPATGDVRRVRITTLDCSKPEWTDASLCRLVRRYAGTQAIPRYGYTARRVEMRYPTVGSLRSFRDRQKRDEAAGLPACSACGKRGNDLVEDLEDGLIKCPGCCDMPAGGA